MIEQIVIWVECNRFTVVALNIQNRPKFSGRRITRQAIAALRDKGTVVMIAPVSELTIGNDVLIEVLIKPRSELP